MDQHTAKFTEHSQDVVDAHGAIAVDVGGATGLAPELSQHRQHVIDSNGTIAIQIPQEQVSPLPLSLASLGVGGVAVLATNVVQVSAPSDVRP